MPPLCHGGKTQQDPVPELEAMLRPPLPWSFGSMLPEVGFYLQKKLTRYFWLQVKEKKKNHLLFKHATSCRKFTTLLQMKVRLCDK